MSSVGYFLVFIIAATVITSVAAFVVVTFKGKK